MYNLISTAGTYYEKSMNCETGSNFVQLPLLLSFVDPPTFFHVVVSLTVSEVQTKSEEKERNG